MATEDLDLEAQAYVEKARTTALIAAYQLSRNGATMDALTRMVAYEELASNARTREEAIGHFNAFDGAYAELQALAEEDSREIDKILRDGELRLKKAKAVRSGLLKPSPNRREF